MTEAQHRHFRFGPRDRASWLLGLSGAQCIAIGAGILVSGLLLNARMPAPVVLTPLLASAMFAFGRWSGRPLHEIAPVALGWTAARTSGLETWFAEMPRHLAGTKPEPRVLQLPPVLGGLVIAEARDAGWTRRGRSAGAAIVRDEREGTISATLRIRGREFVLCERDAQVRQLHLWGDALAAFCTERGPVARVRWTEWAAPAGLAETLAYLDEYAAHDDPSAAVASYRDLLAQAAPMSSEHEVLMTVTVDHRRLRLRRHGSADRAATAEKALLDEVQLLSSRLESAGLIVDLPLSPGQLAEVLRARIDPFSAVGIRTGRRSLAQLAGFVSVSNAGPLAVRAAWDHLQVDRAVHAAYVVAEWPRLEVPPNWMEPLLLHAGGVRTLAVHYEPVAPSRSQRHVDRETVKLASDEEQRTRSGFRIGARHRRAQSEVLDREAELVAGYGEFEFVGFVIVTAPDLDELDHSCAEYEQAAAQAGLELRRLDGRHDLALACALPIGRGIAPRRFA
ncbi:MAG: hypothetical protein M3Q30_19380 [Actinomycetota bacterium]|nr:hypothetical protein [Actinomycetota bacterium]